GHHHHQQREEREEGGVGDQCRQRRAAIVSELPYDGDGERQPWPPLLDRVEPMSQIAGSFQDRSVGRGQGGQTDGSPTLLSAKVETASEAITLGARTTARPLPRER